MTVDKNEESHIGIILVATFFILIATWFFANTSFSEISNPVISIIWSIFGTFFIVVGWGILNTKPWAYYTAIITSSISLLFGLIFLFISPFYLPIILLFIPAIIVMTKYRGLYIEDSLKTPAYQMYNQGRMCTNCGRPIPFDAILCPYCGKKFKNYLKE